MFNRITTETTKIFNEQFTNTLLKIRINGLLRVLIPHSAKFEGNWFMPADLNPPATADYANGVPFLCRCDGGFFPKQYICDRNSQNGNASLNNAPHEIVYHMQDFYKTSAADKWEIVKRQLDSNCYSKPRNEYFYSGLNAAGKIAVAPSTIAKTVNSKFTDYTLDTGKQWGWISFDFVTEALAKKVYSTNIKAKTASDDPSFKKVVLHYDFTSIGDDHVVQDLTGNGFDGIITNPSLITKNNGDITLNNSGKRRLDGAGIDIPFVRIQRHRQRGHNFGVYKTHRGWQ